jgi:hypothetical protein
MREINNLIVERVQNQNIKLKNHLITNIPVLLNFKKEILIGIATLYEASVLDEKVIKANIFLNFNWIDFDFNNYFPAIGGILDKSKDGLLIIDTLSLNISPNKDNKILSIREQLTPSKIKTYIGTKIIQAEPMTNEQFYGEDRKNFTEEPKEGYKVIYEDNYKSWSPKEVFENAYIEINTDFKMKKESLLNQLYSESPGFVTKGYYQKILEEGIKLGKTFNSK